MTMSIPTAGPGVGIRLANVDFRMTCTPGCSKGDVMVVSKDTVANGTFTTVIVPTSVADDIESIDTCVACVALEDVAALGSGMFRFSGFVEAIANGTPGPGLGVEVSIDTTGKLALATAGEKCVGFSVDTAVNDELSTFWFDGINGFVGAFTD